MSALRMVAWGVVTEKDCNDARQWYELKRKAREELVPHNLWITGVSIEDRARGNHALTKLKVGIRRSKRKSAVRYHGGGPTRFAVGDFRAVCRAALERIEPSNHESTDAAR